MKTGRQNREQGLSTRRSREELAQYFMRLRLEEAERKAQEFERTLDPRALATERKSA